MAVVFPDSRLPYANLGGKLSLDDLESEKRSLDFYLFKMVQLGFGNYAGQSGEYGIADTISPVSYRSDMQLLVEPMTSLSLLLKVTSGMAVFPSGALAVIDTVENIELPSTDTGSVMVVYLEYSLREANIHANRYGVSVPKSYEFQDDSSLIKIAMIADFNDLSSDDLKNIVPLAVVTVKTDCTVTPELTSLTVDLTSSVYTWNRPWFSKVDIKHRSEVGTGDSSIPHSLSLNDLLSVGSLGVFDSLNKSGYILSKSRILAKVPGKLCIEEIGNRIISVADSTVFNAIENVGAAKVFFGQGSSDESYFAGVPFKYVELAGYPLGNNFVIWADNDDDGLLDIAKFTYSSGWGQQVIEGDEDNFCIPAYVPKGSNIVVFPDWVDDVLLANYTNLKIAYIGSSALEPSSGSVEAVGSTVEFSDPTANEEAVVVDGQLLASLANASIDFSEAGPIPSMYSIFGKKTDNAATVDVVRSPQTVVSPTLISSVSGTQKPTTNPLVASYLRVGLAYGTLGTTPAGFSVKVAITGKNENGTTITENVWFIGSGITEPTTEEYVYYQWTGDICSGPTNPLSMLVPKDIGGNVLMPNFWSYCWVRTKNKFQSITGWSFPTSPLNAQPETKVVIEAILDHLESRTVRKWCPLAEVSWNGAKVVQIRDVRPINYIAKYPSLTELPIPVAPLAYEISPGSLCLLHEDFERLNYADPLTTKITSHNDGMGGLSANAYPMFGNSLMYPDATSVANYPAPEVVGKYANKWVSKPMLSSFHGGTLYPTSHQTFLLTLHGMRMLNNFNPVLLNGSLYPYDDLVKIRFLLGDTTAGANRKWTTWHSMLRASSLAQPNLFGPVFYSYPQNAGTGYGYEAFGVQVLINDTNICSGVSLWVVRAPLINTN